MIKISIRNLPEVKAYLDNIARNLRGVAQKAMAEYIVGDKTHGLKYYPGYRYVNRYAGFPELGYVSRGGKWVPGWASEKQHRYVMAKINAGDINPGRPNRTDKLSNGWKVVGDLSKSRIINDLPYAGYVQGDEEQTRMHQLIGWRKVAKVVEDNIRGAIRAAETAIQRLADSK